MKIEEGKSTDESRGELIVQRTIAPTLFIVSLVMLPVFLCIVAFFVTLHGFAGRQDNNFLFLAIYIFVFISFMRSSYKAKSNPEHITAALIFLTASIGLPVAFLLVPEFTSVVNGGP